MLVHRNELGIQMSKLNEPSGRYKKQSIPKVHVSIHLATKVNRKMINESKNINRNGIALRSQQGVYLHNSKSVKLFTNSLSKEYLFLALNFGFQFSCFTS